MQNFNTIQKKFGFLKISSFHTKEKEKIVLCKEFAFHF